jgi:hypothetical protein
MRSDVREIRFGAPSDLRSTKSTSRPHIPRGLRPLTRPEPLARPSDLAWRAELEFTGKSGKCGRIDYLSPSRGLLAVSTWPMERRVIGSLSPRVDFLTAAIRIAEAIERIPDPPLTARRLLERFAASIPGAARPTAAGSQTRPDVVRRAAEAELCVHADPDARLRKEAAARAAKQLSAADQFFGIKFQRMTAESEIEAG